MSGMKRGRISHVGKRTRHDTRRWHLRGTAGEIKGTDLDGNRIVVDKIRQKTINYC